MFKATLAICSQEEVYLQGLDAIHHTLALRAVQCCNAAMLEHSGALQLLCVRSQLCTSCLCHAAAKVALCIDSSMHLPDTVLCIGITFLRRLWLCAGSWLLPTELQTCLQPPFRVERTLSVHRTCQYPLPTSRANR